MGRASSGRRVVLAACFCAVVVACQSARTDDAPDASSDAAAGGDGAARDASGETAMDAADESRGDAADATDATDGGDAARDAAKDGADLDAIVDGSNFFDTAGDDGGVCNALANPAANVAQENVATARPAATGGVVLDGTYYKSRDVVYTGAGGSAGLTGFVVRETITIVNASTGTALLESVFTDNSGAGGALVTTTERIAFAPTTGSGATTLTFVCPAYGPSATSFTVRTGDAGQSELDIYIGADRIETFTRQ